MALNTKIGEMALNSQRGWTTALNAEWKTNNGSERRNWETMMALNAKLRMRMALNAKNWEAMMALNAKTKSVDGSERQD